MKIRVTLVYSKPGLRRAEVTTWPTWEAALRWAAMRATADTMKLERVEVIRV